MNEGPAVPDLADRTRAAIAHAAPAASVVSVIALPGGASSLTYLATLAGAPWEQVVVKVAPPGLAPVRNRDVLRQAQVFDSLAGATGICVPTVLGTDTGEAVLRAELVDDDAWPSVTDAGTAPTDLVDLGTGRTHRVPRARGMRGPYLLQIRDPQSPGYCLNPAVVPVHDPALITTLPNHLSWYHAEGCSHLSVEAFWQMSKVVEVRYDRFLALGAERDRPLDGL